MYNNNPFMNVSGMRTPQQVQEDMNRQFQQYQNAYNQAMNFNNQNNMQSPIPNANCYGWKYQEKDDEIETCQIPTNGTPFILIDNNRRVMNIVQFQNGQRYIQTFTYQPFVNYGEPKNNDLNNVSNKDSINTQETDKNSINELFDRLNKRLDNIESRMGATDTPKVADDNPFKKVGMSGNAKSNTNGKGN